MLGHMMYVSHSSAPVISVKEILTKMVVKITAQVHFMNILRTRGAINKTVAVLIHETSLYMRIHAGLMQRLVSTHGVRLMYCSIALITRKLSF